MADFLHLGPARSASTWLAYVLSQHPEVHIPKSKDTEFFSHQYGRGEGWYRNFFSGAKENSKRGEICHRYFWHPLAPSRAQKFNSNFQILINARDPWDRLLSAYHYDRTLYLKKETPLMEYLKMPVVRETVDYVSNIRRWLDHFPEDQIHISFFEELKVDPQLWLNQVWSHLGVGHYWDPSFDEHIWEARTGRSETISHFAFAVSQLLRSFGYYNLVGTVKTKSLVQNVLYQKGHHGPVIEAEDLKRAADIMSRHLQEWQDFKAEWKKKKATKAA